MVRVGGDGGDDGGDGNDEDGGDGDDEGEDDELWGCGTRCVCMCMCVCVVKFTHMWCRWSNPPRTASGPCTTELGSEGTRESTA